MSDGYNFIQLKAGILSLSEANNWDAACKEWGLIAVHDADEPQACLCGHFPIVEICERLIPLNPVPHHVVTDGSEWCRTLGEQAPFPEPDNERVSPIPGRIPAPVS